MHRLEPGDYARVRPLFQGLRHNLVVDSVIDGNTPAWVYVDDASDPQTGWMWNRQDAMLLAGCANDETDRALARLIDEKVIPDAKRRYIPALSLHYFPDDWEERMEDVLAGKHARKALRKFFTFGRLKIDWRRQLPSGCDMRRIDEELLTSTNLKKVEAVAGWVQSFWCSNRAFVQTGLGFCLLRGDAIVSWCLSVYASGVHIELGLATAPDHRGRGYATLTAAACIEHCIENGLGPHWHCWEDNLPSIRVAEKVGFESPINYPVYRFEL